MMNALVRKLTRYLPTGMGVALGCALAVTACKDQRVDVAQSVISAFQSSCVSTGQWTQAALSHSQALVSVMEDLKATDACKPFVSTLGTIQSLSGQINSLLQNDSYSDYRIAEEKLQELTLALTGAAPGSDAASQLSSAVVSTQVDLAEKR